MLGITNYIVLLQKCMTYLITDVICDHSVLITNKMSRED